MDQNDLRARERELQLDLAQATGTPAEEEIAVDLATALRARLAALSSEPQG